MKKISAFLLVLLVLMIPGAAQGVPLLELFNSSEGLIVDDKMFYGWSLSGVISTDPSLDPDFSQIEVIPLADQSLNPGIRFETNGQLATAGVNFLDVTFGFKVAVLNPNLYIKDNSLAITAFSSFGFSGAIAIRENVSDVGGSLLAEKEVSADILLGSFNLFDSAEFAPVQVIEVEKNIFISTLFDGDFMSLDSFEQRFSQIPEPSTMVFVAIGLLVIGYLCKRLNWVKNR
jgi:hypothetical protein